MRRFLEAAILLAALLVLQGGVVSHADDELGTKRSVVTGWVHELIALGGGGGLRVRLTQPDGQLTALAEVQGTGVRAVLHSAFLAKTKVTVVFKKTGPKLAAVRAILRRQVVTDASGERVGRSAEATSGSDASSADRAARAAVPCVWPDVLAEPRRPSQLLEEIRSWVRAAAVGTDIDAADRTAILALTQQIDELDSTTVDAAGWPWPYVHLRSIWGKAAFAFARGGAGAIPALGEWTEVKTALANLQTLDPTVPEGLVLPEVGACVWPHGANDFAAPHFLLQNLSELSVKALEGGRIDEMEFIELLSEIDRCMDPGLVGHNLPNPPVCDLDWPAPYRRLLGIWGKALYAQGAGPSTETERQEEWDQVLLSIQAFPDELENPRGGGSR